MASDGTNSDAAQCLRARARLDPDAFVFSLAPDHSSALLPSYVSQRYRRLVIKVGLRSTRLHALRHYSATDLLSAGVDLRTVAGHLGHRGRRRARFCMACPSARSFAAQRRSRPTWSTTSSSPTNNGDAVTRSRLKKRAREDTRGGYWLQRGRLEPRYRRFGEVTSRTWPQTASKVRPRSSATPATPHRTQIGQLPGRQPFMIGICRPVGSDAVNGTVTSRTPFR